MNERPSAGGEDQRRGEDAALGDRERAAVWRREADTTAARLRLDESVG